jgi:regulator of sigma E protease
MPAVPIDINRLLAMPNAILAVAVVLGLAVFFHEAGHFLAARLCGIGVEEFAIGFGRPLWQRRRGATLYSLRMLPLGGFARITGMEQGEADVPGGVYTKPRYTQALVFASGALMNVVLALLLFVVVIFWRGLPDIKATGITVDRPLSGSAAAKAGFKAGDRIVTIDGHRVCLVVKGISAEGLGAKSGLAKGMAIVWGGRHKVAVPADLLAVVRAADGKPMRIVVEDPKAKSLQGIYKPLDVPVSEELRALAEFTPKEPPATIDELIGHALGVEWAAMTSGAMADYIGVRPGKPVAVALDREGQQMVLTTVPTAQWEREPELGPDGTLQTPHRLVGRIGVLLGTPHRKAGFVEGMRAAAWSTVGSVATVVGALHAMATRQISPDVGGPISIMAMTAEQARIGWDAVLGLGGLISANLAVVNLFPFPPFDGFYLLMTGWEGITRRRINERWRHAFLAAGFILIICLFLVFTYRDVFNLVRYRTP